MYGGNWPYRLDEWEKGEEEGEKKEEGRKENGRTASMGEGTIQELELFTRH